MLSDIRRGLRSLVAKPSFVVLAVACLGIGIGASTMTFTAVNHALLKPLGPVDPEGLVVERIDAEQVARVRGSRRGARVASRAPAVRAARVDPNALLKS